MAKQKKKQQKKKAMLSKEDKGLFSIVFIIPFVIIILLLLNYKRVAYFCASLFLNDFYYAQIKLNFFSVLMVVLGVIELISIVILSEQTAALAIPFKEYYSGKNVKANQQIKNFLIYSCCLVLLFVGSFAFASQSKIVATGNQITSCNIIKNDEVLIDYSDVETVNVYVEKSLNPKGIKGYASYSYYPVVELYTENSSIELNASGFNYDYTRMQQFLSLFDKSKIKTNNTNIELVHISNSSQQESLESVFK